MFESTRVLPSKSAMSLALGVVSCLFMITSQAAPAPSTTLSHASSPSGAEIPDHKSHAAALEAVRFEATRQLPVAVNNNSPALKHQEHQKVQAGESEGVSPSQKVRRDSKAKSSDLDIQETGHYLPSAYPSATESDYGYDAGKNSYGKQASDWSLYDQGNHGLYDKYGDKAWKDQGHNDHASHGKHDSYGNSYNSHGSGHGSGYYSRDRGYGYEKHYAYDKEVASKHHADSHNNYGSQHGLHDNYGNSASNSHLHQGHDKYGQASRYGNHGYGKRGSNLAANHDYAHNQNKAHYYAHSAPQTSYSSYGSHVPTYRSTYSDYTPQVGYPSSYPSYY